MKMRIYLAPGAALLAGLLAWSGCGGKGDGNLKVETVKRDSLKVTVQATGNVEPLNKVQIVPPVGGRIDQILAFEGHHVKKGQVLAWMSSSDRAALLDMARAQGPEEVKYWQDVYKATPVVAPTDGTIITRNIVEGQTINNTTVIYELSDRLVVRAQVDENDIGKVHLGQLADVNVDAFPDKPFSTKVVLINPSSVLVNNVVSYFVLLQPLRLPGELKSGMTANVNFIVKEKDDILVVPSYVVKGEENTVTNVGVLTKPGEKPERRQVELGDSDGTKVEVVSGLQEHEKVVVSGLRLQDAASTGLFGGPARPNSSNQGKRGGGGH